MAASIRIVKSDNFVFFLANLRPFWVNEFNAPSRVKPNRRPMLAPVILNDIELVIAFRTARRK